MGEARRRAPRLQSIDGIPVWGCAFDPRVKPHHSFDARMGWAPCRVKAVFNPLVRTGWYFPGTQRQVLGAWVVLTLGTIDMPSYVSESGVLSHGGTQRAWRGFWLARVPSLAASGGRDEPGRPYFMYREAECKNAVRVLREYTPWRRENIARMHEEQLAAATEANRVMARQDLDNWRLRMRPEIAKFLSAVRDADGTVAMSDAEKRADRALTAAQEVEREATIDYIATAQDERSAEMLRRAQVKTEAAQRALDVA